MTFIGLLTLLLVAAKLFGFAHYGWFVAFAPVLIETGLVLVVAIVDAVLAALR